MQIQDQPHIGVLGADPAAITQFLRRVQALGGEHAVLLPLSPAAVPDCEPYLCGASTQPPLRFGRQYRCRPNRSDDRLIL